jgi:hypothetical protein
MNSPVFARRNRDPHESKEEKRISGEGNRFSRFTPALLFSPLLYYYHFPSKFFVTAGKESVESLS